MRDIGTMLDKIMQEKQCSSVYALLLLSEGEHKKNGIHKLQREFIQSLYSNTDTPKEREMLRNLIDQIKETV